MRLKEDSTSWKSGGIKRRDFRHDPGLPETEIARHKSVSKAYKKKHEHTYEARVLGTQVVRRSYRMPDGSWQRREYEEPKTQWVCTGCGNKRNHWRGW